MQEPLVLYIIGDHRSGSTLLDYLLSWHPDATTIGELSLLKDHYYKTSPNDTNNWTCNCGDPLNECEFWDEILSNLSLSDDFETKVEFFETRLSFLSKKMQKMELHDLLKEHYIQERGRQVAENCWALYKAIYKRTNKPLIIDSSKTAMQAYFLNKYKKGNIRFLRIEREIEAVAFSKFKREKEIAEIRKGFTQKSIFHYLAGSSMVFFKNRFFSELINEKNNYENQVLKINYNDLAKEPLETIRKITDQLNLSSFNVPNFTNKKREQVNHTIAGSPSRHKQRKIEPDVRYKSFYNKNLTVKIFIRLFRSRFKSTNEVA